MSVTNLRVVCKIITCVSAFTEMAILLIFLEIVNAACLDCRIYVNDAIVGACHCTSDGQEHKIIWRANQNEAQFFTYMIVTVCREQGSHCRDERLAWVASRGQGTSYSNSLISKVLGAN